MTDVRVGSSRAARHSISEYRRGATALPRGKRDGCRRRRPGPFPPHSQLLQNWEERCGTRCVSPRPSGPVVPKYEPANRERRSRLPAGAGWHFVLVAGPDRSAGGGWADLGGKRRRPRLAALSCTSRVDPRSGGSGARTLGLIVAPMHRVGPGSPDPRRHANATKASVVRPSEAPAT